MSDAEQQLRAELLAACQELEAKSRVFVLVQRAHVHVELCMVYYAQLIETERSVRLSHQLDQAIRDVWVTAISGAASLGIGTAIAAFASGGATLTAAGTAALRAKNVELAAAAATRAAAVTSEASTTSRALTFLGKAWQWTSGIGSGLPGCSGMVSPNAFAQLGLSTLEGHALTAIGMGNSYLLNKGVGACLTRAWAHESWSEVGIEKYKEWAKKTDQLTQLELNSLHGDWLGLLPMTGPEFMKLAEKIDGKVQDHAGASMFPGRATHYVRHTEQEARSYSDRHGSRMWYVPVEKTEAVINPGWQQKLNTDEKKKLRQAADQSLRNLWTAAYGKTMPQYEALRIRVGTLELKCDRLVRQIEDRKWDEMRKADKVSKEFFRGRGGHA